MKKPNWKMKHFLQVLVMFSMLCSSAMAQKRVTGLVTDKVTGEPIPGANIIAKGETKGAFAGLDGKYTMLVKNDEVILVVRAPGYQPLEEKVGTRREINFKLNIEVSAISNSIITALGFVAETPSLGYAAQKVTGSTLNDVPSDVWTSALVGKIPGLSLTSLNGGPSGTKRLSIRGESSLELNRNQPLIVMDGVPQFSDYIGNGRTQFAGTTSDYPVDNGNVLADFNTDDIESVSILKGAAATALYGTRGANGVIMVTTKTGGKAASGLGVTLNSSLSVESAYNLPDYQYKYGQGSDMSGYNYLTGLNSTSLEAWGPKFDGQTYNQIGGSRVWKATRDQQSEYLKSGVNSTTSVAVDAGNRTTKARIAFGYSNTDWMVDNVSSRRYSASTSISHKLSSILRVEGKVNYVNRYADNLPSLGYGSSSIPSYLLALTPNMRNSEFNTHYNYVIDPVTGTETAVHNRPYSSNLDNPNIVTSEMLNRVDRDAFNGMFSVSCDIVKQVSFTLRTSIGYSYEERSKRRPYLSRAYVKGMYEEQQVKNREMNTEAFFGFKDTYINKKLEVNAYAGGNLMNTAAGIYRVYADSALAVPNTYNFQNSMAKPKVSSLHNNRGINSAYGTAQISWDKFLYVGGNVRNDWTSTFKKGSNDFLYGSANASLILSRIYQKYATLPDWIDIVRVRGSYGISGNEIPNYSLSLVYENSDILANFTTPDQSTVPFLKPEITKSFEYGANMSFLKGRLDLDLTYYNDNVDDLMIPMEMSPTTGYTFGRLNAGKMSKSGFEFIMNATPVVLKNGFNWKTTVNFTSMDNTIKSLSNVAEYYVIASPLSDKSIELRAQPGYRYGALFGAVFEHQANGLVALNDDGITPKVKTDENGDVVKEYLGCAFANFYWGWSNDLSYKNWKVSFQLDGQMGGSAYSGNYQQLSAQGKLTNTTFGVRDNNTATFYRAYFAQNIGESNVSSTDYIKLRELKVEFAFPKKWYKTTPINSVSLAAWGRNLAMLTKFDGYDPEAAAVSENNIIPGFELGSFPASRSFGLNLKMTF